MLISQYNRLVPGQRLIQGGREYEIVKKDRDPDQVCGGYNFTLKTRIGLKQVYCTTTTDPLDPDIEDCKDWIGGCETLGRVWSPGESGDLSQ